jgi:hypothetical protein
MLSLLLAWPGDSSQRYAVVTPRRRLLLIRWTLVSLKTTGVDNNVLFVLAGLAKPQ